MALPLTKPLVGSLRDLEFRLGVKRVEIYELINSRPSLYQPFEKTKKLHPYPGALRRQAATRPAKKRKIDNPVSQLKDIQRRILKSILSEVELPSFMFGAVSGKTLLGHADVHVANQASALVHMDISSYRAYDVRVAPPSGGAYQPSHCQHPPRLYLRTSLPCERAGGPHDHYMG